VTSASGLESTGEAGSRAAKLPETSAKPIAMFTSMINNGLGDNSVGTQCNASYNSDRNDVQGREQEYGQHCVQLEANFESIAQGKKPFS
jgi:hypothetical protein